MAVDIETQMYEFERLVKASAGAAEGLALISEMPGNLTPGAAYASLYLAELLQEKFHILWASYAEIMPFVRDLKAGVRHG